MRGKGNIKSWTVKAFWGLAACFALAGNVLKAQVIDPVTVSPVIQPPYSVYLSNYFVPGNERFAVNLVFNDFNEPSIDVRFRVKIEGHAFQLRTRNNFNPAPITIYPGANVISAQDIEQYFNFNNLEAFGISKQQLLQTGALPEGYYTFCIEVLDYQSGTEISNMGCASATLIRNMPPIHVMPQGGSSVPVQEPQNVLFQWQPISDLAVSTGYEITLVEVPPGINPNDAVNATSTPLLDAEPVNAPLFYYGPDQLPLEIGKQYAWRVRAFDLNDIAVFENNGLSEVTTFTYGFPLNGAIVLQTPFDSATVDPQSAYLQWTAPDNAVMGTALSYHLKVFEIQDGQTALAALANPAVYEEESPLVNHLGGFSSTPANGLEKGKTYAWQVTAEVGGVEVAKSAPGVFMTTPDVQVIYAGSHQVAVTNITNGDKNNLAGTGKLKIFEDEADYDVQFSGLHIKKVAGKWILDDGQLAQPLQSREILVPVAHVDDAGTFMATSAVLDKTGLKLQGHAEIPVVLGEDSGLIVTDSALVLYGSYKITHSFAIPQGQQVSLGGAEGFVITTGENSLLNVVNGTGTFMLDGILEMPVSVAGHDGQRVVFQLQEVEDLKYIDEGMGTFQNRISVWGSALSVKPTSFTFDFHLNESSGEMASNPAWTGLEMQKFELVHDFPSGHPSRLQMDLKGVKYDKATLDSASAYADLDGLDLVLHDDYASIASEADYINFTAPVGKLTAVDIVVENGQMATGEMKGYVTVPMVSATDRFAFTVPMGDSAQSYFELAQVTGGNGHVVELDRPTLAFDAEGRLGGNGQILLDPQDSTSFEGGLQQVLLASTPEGYSIQEGEVLASLTNFEREMEYPGYKTSLSFTRARVDANGLFVETVPEAFETGLASVDGPVEIPFAKTWLDYNNYKVNDQLRPSVAVAKELLDPMGFALSIDTSSVFTFKDNVLSYQLDGMLELAAAIQNTSGEKVSVPFADVENLHYFTLEGEQVDGVEVRLVKNTSIAAGPTMLTVDLSEGQSPASLASQKEWKGVYLNSFKLALSDNIDQANALVSDKKISLEISSTTEEYICASGSGLQVKVHEAITGTSTEKNYMAYHGFEGKFTGIGLQVKDGQLEDGWLKSNISVPLLSRTKAFSITVPFASDGLGNGYFADDIEGQSNTFLKGKDMEVTLEVNQAQFNSAGQVSLNINLDFPGYDITMQQLDHFIIAGDGKVGFGQINGTHVLTDQVTGSVGGSFSFTARQVRAYELDEHIYGFQVDGTMVVAENLASPDGGIAGSFTSFLTDQLQDNVLWGYAHNEKGELSKFEIGSPIMIPVGPVQFQAKFVYTKGDPDWGNSVQTFAKAKLKVPVPFHAMVKVIVGEKNGFNYWFAQAGAGLLVKAPADSTLASLQKKAQDEAAKDPNALPPKDNNTATTDKKKFDGIPIGPVKLIGFEGRIYHHMGHKEGGGIADADYVPNQDIVFGFYVKVSCIDAATNGGNFMIDGSIEADFNGAGLNTIAIAADVQIGNKTGVGQTNNATIIAKGSISFNVPNKHLIANLSGESNDPKLCMTGALALDIKPGKFSVDLGSEDKMIMVTPGCAGWGFVGFLHVDEINLKVGGGISYSAEFKTGWQHIAVVMAMARAEVGIAGGVTVDLDYRPVVKLNRAGIWITAWGSVTVGMQAPALSPVPLHEIKQNITLNLASIRLTGKADVYFQDPKKLKGSFDGLVRLLDMYEFSFKLEGEVPLS